MLPETSDICNAMPLQEPLMPKDQPPKTSSFQSRLHRHAQSSSWDRATNKRYLDWRKERARSASVGGETLIPDTEPEELDDLWKRIRRSKDQGMAPGNGDLLVEQGRNRSAKLDKRKAQKGEEESETASVEQSTNNEDSKTAITTATSATGKAKKASPYDKDFRIQVLTPRGISVVREHHVSPWDHFDTTEPFHSNRQQYYKETVSEHSSVWLDVDETLAEAVAREYGCMEGMCEAKFASYAREVLLKRDPRVPPTAYSKDRAWRTDRMLELVAKPHDNWEPPLLLHTSDEGVKQYDFDIRPDCAYWLSLQAFNAKYASEIEDWAFVVNRRITCPYLFIEFKKDDKDVSSAENQVATAGSIALYNRYNLRMARLEQGKTPPELDAKNIKIYGITFGGARYAIWCIRPQLITSQWVGCTMTRLSTGCCIFPDDVKDLVDWINEIHRWGLSVHGPSCENDLKICIGGGSGGSRVSAVNKEVQ